MSNVAVHNAMGDYGVQHPDVLCHALGELMRALEVSDLVVVNFDCYGRIMLHHNMWSPAVFLEIRIPWDANRQCSSFDEVVYAVTKRRHAIFTSNMTTAANGDLYTTRALSAAVNRVHRALTDDEGIEV